MSRDPVRWALAILLSLSGPLSAWAEDYWSGALVQWRQRATDQESRTVRLCGDKAPREILARCATANGAVVFAERPTSYHPWEKPSHKQVESDAFKDRSFRALEINGLICGSTLRGIPAPTGQDAVKWCKAAWQ